MFLDVLTPSAEKVEISGEVESIVFRHPDNDWAVLRMRIVNMRDQQTVVGHTNAQPGQHLSAMGTWTNDRTHGRQFKADRITATNPHSEAGIIRYLSSGVLKGVGAKTAKQLVDRYGKGTLQALEGPVDALLMPGIGKKKALAIHKSWQEQRSVAEIMLFLHSQNVTPALCRRIFKEYGETAMHVMREDPYRLALEVKGVGFKTADAIAENLGVPKNSPQRIRAGLVYLMQEAATGGNCGVLAAALSKQAQEYLGVEALEVLAVLDAELRLGNGDDPGQARAHFVAHHHEPSGERAVFLAGLARSEEAIAERLADMASKEAAWSGRINADKAVAWAEKECGMALAPEQRTAVIMALRSRVSVLTGGPGCGKTATLSVLLTILQKAKVRIALAAPTGKAAQRAKEATGIEASTIHRLIGLKGPGGGATEKVDADLIVVDESSMLDVPLTNQLIKALREGCALLLVGDVDQLPSVGPGQVLRDIIDSGRVPVTRLTQVFRQAAGSLIIRNAHAINAGQMPQNGGFNDDFFIYDETYSRPIAAALALQATAPESVPAATGEACAEEIVSLVRDRLVKRYGFDPVRDIQVLSPMSKGACGVNALNARLQQALNPENGSDRNPNNLAVTRLGIRFAVGDKVIQTRNNYDLGIFNGDTGLVIDVLVEEEELVVDMAGRLIQIPFEDLDDLRLSYAITIHKSQGSQARAVVIPMTTQHWTMLQRNLLYTAVTRARELVVLVGVNRAIAVAVRTTSSTKRVTRLAQLLSRAE